jgi:hypothetical protein
LLRDKRKTETNRGKSEENTRQAEIQQRHVEDVDSTRRLEKRAPDHSSTSAPAVMPAEFGTVSPAERLEEVETAEEVGRTGVWMRGSPGGEGRRPD